MINNKILAILMFSSIGFTTLSSEAQTESSLEGHYVVQGRVPNVTVINEEEDGLLPAPSFISVILIVSLLSRLVRRR